MYLDIAKDFLVISAHFHKRPFLELITKSWLVLLVLPFNFLSWGASFDFAMKNTIVAHSDRSGDIWEKSGEYVVAIKRV